MIKILPTLLDGSPTRDTLHRYSRVAGAVRRSLSLAHPLWWHISLHVYPDGLTTTPIEVLDRSGTMLEIRLNLRRHRLEITCGNESREIDLTEGLTATDLGDQTVELIKALGFERGIDRSLYTNDTDSLYDTTSAEEYLSALLWIESCFSAAAQEIGGDTGPVQLWPHHFDLSFEWFGTRLVESEEVTQTDGARAQIGFGFSLGDSSVSQPYFYATPWPFEQQAISQDLPHGASWYQDSWQGALLLYETIRAEGETRLRDFIKTVHAVASPGLTV